MVGCGQSPLLPPILHCTASCYVQQLFPPPPSLPAVPSYSRAAGDSSHGRTLPCIQGEAVPLENSPQTRGELEQRTVNKQRTIIKVISAYMYRLAIYPAESLVLREGLHCPGKQGGCHGNSGHTITLTHTPGQQH